jgi:uncharacterized protein (DUF1499 family)/NADH:ubiquinone oxidoreductase subunit 6 (subunit J)
MLWSLLALGITALSLALLGLAGPAHRLGFSLASAYQIVIWTSHIGGAAALAAIVIAIRAYRARGWMRLAVAAVAIVVGLTSFAIGFDTQRRREHSPSIHDITTDLDNPPTFTAVIARRADAPNRLDRSPGLAELQRQGYPDLAPVTVQSRPDQTFDRALAAAQSLGWEIVTADKSSGRIEATDKTRWFGFVDDVAVRLTPWGSGTRIDVRSVSRTGVGDAGRNAARIRRFLNELQR